MKVDPNVLRKHTAEKGQIIGFNKQTIIDFKKCDPKLLKEPGFS